MGDDPKVEVIKPPDKLKDKVKSGVPGGVDERVLEKAEAVVTSMGGEFVQWAEEDLKSLLRAFDGLKAGTADQKESLRTIFKISHDIKGQGGSFDYDLLTAIGDSLCRLIEDKDRAGPAEIEAIKLHAEALNLVLTNRLKGDGGDTGANLLDGL